MDRTNRERDRSRHQAGGSRTKQTGTLPVIREEDNTPEWQQIGNSLIEGDRQAYGRAMDELLQLGLMMEIHENGKTYVGLNSKGKALGYLMISWIERDLEVLSHA